MKIIRQGYENPSGLFVGTCPHCKSKLEATKAELDCCEWDPKELGWWGAAWCIVCGGRVNFYPKRETQ